MLRRSPERPRQLREIRIPGATLDSANRLITFKDGRETSLTAREFEFLTYIPPTPTALSQGTNCSGAYGTWTRA